MKKELLKTLGWTAIVAGAYCVYLGSMYDDGVTRIRPDDDIIDVDFTIIEE